MRLRLMALIDRLAASQDEPDYHPGSNDRVLDIVHPALYSYVAGPKQNASELCNFGTTFVDVYSAECSFCCQMLHSKQQMGATQRFCLDLSVSWT